jgi:hypothetical protein
MLGGCGVGGLGRRHTYGYSAEKCFYKFFVCCQVFQDLAVRREVDEDSEGIIRDLLLDISSRPTKYSEILTL